MNFASTAVRGATLALILLARYCATTYENGGAVQETSKAWHTNLTCLCEPVQTLESSSVMRLVQANYFMLLYKLLLVRELLTSLINKVAACLSKIVSRGNLTYSIFYTVCKLATGDVIKQQWVKSKVSVRKLLQWWNGRGRDLGARPLRAQLLPSRISNYAFSTTNLFSAQTKHNRKKCNCSLFFEHF